jgi:hypothetical protein
MREFSLAVAVAAVSLGAAPVSSDFTAPPALLAEAKSYVGKSCQGYYTNRAKFMPGFTVPKGFQMVIGNGAYALPMEKGGARFLVLFQMPNEAPSCKISDVAVLPTKAQANTLLECYSDPGSAVKSGGVGMRKAGLKKLVAYWEIHENNGKLVRVAADAVAKADLMCQQPEGGE